MAGAQSESAMLTLRGFSCAMAALREASHACKDSPRASHGVPVAPLPAVCASELAMMVECAVTSQLDFEMKTWTRDRGLAWQKAGSTKSH